MLQPQKIQTLNHLDSQWELKTEEDRGAEVQEAWEAFWKRSSTFLEYLEARLTVGIIKISFKT